MELSLGYSPCPNDTFMFDALVNGKLDTGDLKISPRLEDVAALNRLAFNGELDVTKLSFHAMGHVLDQYELLRSGAALGRNCGPLLIAKKEIAPDQIKHHSIAIPGKYTTANFLLSLAFPEAKNKQELIFSEVEDAVLNGDADIGLIIHENRFTYQDKGLVKLIDLGEYWEGETGKPIPLGGIVIKRSLPDQVKKQFEQLLSASVQQAFEDPKGTESYVKAYAQEMNPEVLYQHINLYVNDYSVDLGTDGVDAVMHLFETASQLNIIPKLNKPVLLST